MRFLSNDTVYWDVKPAIRAPILPRTRDPMKIHEYQAKEILRHYNVPRPRGKVAYSADEAKAVAEKLGGKVVVKAQIHAGGRGKGGGVKLAGSPARPPKSPARSWA